MYCKVSTNYNNLFVYLFAWKSFSNKYCYLITLSATLRYSIAKEFARITGPLFFISYEGGQTLKVQLQPC